MIAIVLAFYSPCGYELPQRHLARTLAWAAGTGADVTLAQVVGTGQRPQPVPSGIRSLVYQSDDVLFFKENLLNLAAAATTADRLLFMDADIEFSADDILERVEESLDSCDVVQPFEIAAWRDQTGCVFQSRRAAAYALASGWEPRTIHYHPGFSWAMTRSAFDRLGGWYERHPFGGGDVAFLYSLDRRWVNTVLPRHIPLDADYWQSPSYKAYQAHGVSLELRVGCVAGVTAYHSWHGETENRRYSSRGVFMSITPGTDYPLRHRPDGLLQWTDPKASGMVRRYFEARREDG